MIPVYCTEQQITFLAGLAKDWRMSRSGVVVKLIGAGVRTLTRKDKEAAIPETEVPS